MPYKKPLRVGYREAGLVRIPTRDGGWSVRGAGWGVPDPNEVARTPFEQAEALGLVNATPAPCPLASVIYSQANAEPPPRKVAEPKRLETGARAAPGLQLIGKVRGAGGGSSAPLAPSPWPLAGMVIGRPTAGAEEWQPSAIPSR